MLIATKKLKTATVKVVNIAWDGHHQSYDLVVLFTGNMNYDDGDGNV